MSGAFGRQNRDGVFGSISINNTPIIDGDRNLQNIEEAQVRGILLDGTGRSVYRKIRNATVSVLVNGTSTCSGWFVTANGWVATAAHCVIDGQTLADGLVAVEDVCVTVTGPNGQGDDVVERVQPTAIYVDGAADFAMMKLPGFTKQEFLPWGSISTTGNGSRCFVVGNPLGVDTQSISDGVVRDNKYTRSMAVATESVLISAPVYPGNSGSPIVTERCEVIGIVSFQETFVREGVKIPADTLVGGTSSRLLKGVADWIIANEANYTAKGWLGVDAWYPLDAFHAKDLGLPTSFGLKGMRVSIASGSPCLSATSGPDMPLSARVIILTVDGVKVGDSPTSQHFTTPLWFKSSGSTATVEWVYEADFDVTPPTTYTSVITLGSWPAAMDGFGVADLSAEVVPPMIRSGSQVQQGSAIQELIANTYTSRDPDDTPEQFSRLIPADYADGASSPSGTDRPNPRAISNAVFDTTSVGIPHPENFTDFFWLWGQFLDHDITLAPEHDPHETITIAIPTGDPDFDPESTGTVTITMNRTIYDEATGTEDPREQLNFITPYIDATNVYGTDTTRTTWLRSGINGKLKSSPGNLPPFNDGTQSNANSPTGNAPFVVGDVRGNEQTLLLALHTLFMREHNRWAEAIYQADSSLTDEQIYQKARVMVESIIQCITWYEFLPALLGDDALPAYTGYDSEVNTQITNVFATAAYRLGHSLVSETLWRLTKDNDPSPLGHLELKDAFFMPARFMNDGGLEPLFRGAAKHVCQALDAKIVPALRNFLFGPPGAGGLDLAALNIQRGREHGLTDYNSARVALGLGAKANFGDISSDSDVASALSTAYGGDIDTIDIWVGGLCEDHVEGSQLGELFHTIVVEQFTRLRDGDELWFENRLSSQLQQYVRTIKLADVIRNNTSITTEIQDEVMKL